MKFGRLKIKNFMAFHEAELNLSKPGVYLIDGQVTGSQSFTSNGAGKSSIFEALTWCLFGKTLRKLDSANDVVNLEKGRDCIVSVSFVVDKTKHKIVRYRKHKNHKNQVTLIVGGKKIRESSKRHTQDRINRILGIDYQSFTNSVVFGQGDIEKFSTASDAVRKQIFEELLQLNYISEAQDRAKERYAELVNREREARDKAALSWRDLKAAETELDKLNSLKLEHRRSRLAYLVSQIERLEALEAEIRSLEEETLPNIDEHYVEDLSIRVSRLHRKHRKLVNKSIHVDPSGAKSNERAMLTLELELERNTTTLAELQRKAKRKHCPTCGQLMPKQGLKTQIDTLKLTNADIRTRLKQLEKKQNKLTSQLEKQREHEEKIKTLERIITRAREELAEAKYERSLRKERFGRLRAAYQSLVDLERSLSSITDDRLDDTELRSQVTDTIRTKEVEFREQGEYVADLEEERNYVYFWVNAFSNKGLKADIIDSIIPYLNQRVGEYARILTDGELSLSFSSYKRIKSGALRRKLDVSVSKQRGGASYSQISAGEKRRADFCQCLALRDVIASRGGSYRFPILFLDECFESLDDAGVDRILALLEELHKSSPTILVATHLPDIKHMFANRITVQNDKGVARIL